MNIARTFKQRFLGARTQSLPLYIPHCKAIHTFGIPQSLDLLWVDEKKNVIRKDRGVKPWRIKICGKAFGVIESKSKGQALVEAALVLPWMMVLVWALFQFGILLLHQYQMLQATQRAAQNLMQTNNDTLSEAIFYQAVPTHFQGTFTITSQNELGGFVSNNLRKNGDIAFLHSEWEYPFSLVFWDNNIKLKARSLAVIVCDNPLGKLSCR